MPACRMLGMLAMVALNICGILQADILAAGLLKVTGCLSLESARKSIDFRVLLVIACAFGLGAAIQKVGLSTLIVTQTMTLAGTNPFVLLGMIYLITVLLTETITNNAAAIVMFPIAVSTAESLGVNVTTFAVAVMIAASASFMTPIGYQTNLMVQGPGGYHFTDYMRLGFPLSVIVGITSIGLIPMIWPF